MAMKNIFSNILINKIIETSASTEQNSNVKLVKKLLKDRQKKRIIATLKVKKSKTKRKIPKVPHFIQIIKRYPDDIFSNHFRMTKNTFEIIYEMLRPAWHVQKTGRPGYPLKVCLYITLWKLCNLNSFREISDRFNIGSSSAYRIFVRTSKLISSLKKETIQFPSTASSQKRIIEGFENSRSHPFPFVLGCIDGMHIRITAPTTDAISYYNRKGFHSILVQGVVDSKLRFIDAFVGYPGRCHDATVWHNSPLKKAITNNTLKLPPECHLLGDAAYPLESYLMVPYKDNGFLSEEEKRYNNILSSTRVHVEQAFGVLKKKFRILNYLELQRLKLAKDIVMACIVIHNIIINNEGCGTLDSCRDESEDDQSNSNNELYTECNEREQAKQKRERLKNLLSA